MFDKFVMFMVSLKYAPKKVILMLDNFEAHIDSL